MSTGGGRTGSGVQVPGTPTGAGPISRPVVDVEGSAGVFIGTDRASGDIVAVVYQQDKPGWWRGVIRGNRVREMYLPGLEPPQVVEKFLG
jgi:hypothetical protein